ncbi:uncharacterized protein B0H64DRAFT_463102 [Chaetomium fimeti]|uniref:Uncharacterized protein n=1 Tax=Chaetomium fimeti TaxID=1854472 RepID=A0AAE0HDL9_9PEZI|nr:hypothetical protein B0H64DRAFT_463102 [Chaetomium fimeti]
MECHYVPLDAFDANSPRVLPVPAGFPVMRIVLDSDSGSGSSLPSEPQRPPESLTLPSKFSLTDNENLVVLGKPIKMENDKITRAAEAFTSATKLNEAGKSGDDREVVNTTTTAGNPANPASKKNKKKSAKQAASSSAVGESATTVKSEDGAKSPAAVTREMWSQMRALLEGSDDSANSTANRALFKEMFARASEHAAHSAKAGARPGPVCGNPVCGAFGHTLAVCPVPTSEEGDMAGCFFCNVVNHDADDCPMMEWVSPATLVTHLITNRAGMPPWDTRVDWVALAIGEWDLLCFTQLPLTRAFVREEYIPGKRWTEVKGVSPITDPLFEDADHKLLKSLARPKRDDTKCSCPLMEASRTLCYCENGCLDGLEHTVFKNKLIRKYIAEVKLEYKVTGGTLADRERHLAVSQAQMAKRMPKKVTKERKGRRAMKKDAMAAAAAEEELANPSETKNVPAEKNDQVEKEDDPPSDEKNQTDLSQRFIELADAVTGVINNLEKGIKACHSAPLQA